MLDKTPMHGDLRDFDDAVVLHKVDETKWESYWDKLVDSYHYLGYGWQFGGRVKYVITMGERIVGAIGFCAAVLRLAPRDRCIGITDETRAAMLPYIVNNNRFLIMPWVHVKNLASHALSLSLKRMRADWERQYGIRPYLVETFVDGAEFEGTCYKAANWACLGKTRGFGRVKDGLAYHGRPKDIYVKALCRRLPKPFSLDKRRLSPEREELARMINGLPMWDPFIMEWMGLPGIIEGGPEALNEAFADHLAPYLPYLGRIEHHAHLLTQVKGRLSDLARKSNEPVALAFSGAGSVRNMANFMRVDKWDDKGMLAAYRKEAQAMLFEPGGMITGDGCDFPKKGTGSVGVARQYCGRLGKNDSCQASVMVGYAGARGYGLLDYGLYMPKAWFDDGHSELREKTLVPENLEFKTKNQMLSEMIGKIAASRQFKGSYVGVDSSFGTDKAFLDSLPEGLIYFADVHNNVQVFARHPELVLPAYSGKGRRPSAPKCEPAAVSVKSIAEDAGVPWADFVLAIGSKGPIIARDKVVPVVEVRDGRPGRGVWLYIRQMDDGPAKYALCNAPANSSPEDIRRPALMRWSIEQCFKECKEYLGMDHYEARSWPGWHRHMLITLLAHLFVNKLRVRFSVMPHSPSGPAPYIESPVPLGDYLDAAKKLENGEEIDHADISEYPDKPQQVMTIGLVLKLIAPFLIKTGAVLSEIDYYLKSFARAYASHSRTTLRGFGLSCRDPVIDLMG
jgi:SRSO17 transposase